LYGLKVPNAWDFYNYDVGDKFCLKYEHTYTHGYLINQCYDRKYIIQGKSNMTNGYNYTVNDFLDNCSLNSHFTPLSSFDFNNLSEKLIENVMYPGQIITSNLGFNFNFYFNIVRFGLDERGTFYKYAGYPCTNYSNISFPNNSSNTFGSYKAYDTLNRFFYPSSFSSHRLTEMYAVGLGMISKLVAHWDYAYYHEEISYCQTFAYKNNSVYYGTESTFGLNELALKVASLTIYPNPSDGKLYLQMERQSFSEIKIINTLGQVTLYLHTNKQTETLEIDLSNQSPGIYFVQAFEKGKLMAIEKFIKN